MKAPRSFRVDPSGVAVVMTETEALDHMGVPGDVSAAYDVLTDDGMPSDKAAEMAFAAHRSGRDAEAFARHVVKLRKAIR